jgi:hypothetical protein
MRGSQLTNLSLEVTDLETNSVSVYTTMREAAKAIGSRSGNLSNYFTQSKKQKPYRGRYLLRKL